MKPTKTLRGQLFRLTGPIFVETLLIMLLGAMDTFMLSHYSDDTVAAVGVVNQLLNLVFLVFGVSTVGTSVLCSQYLGASQQANVRQVIGVSLVFNTLIGVTTSAFLYFRAEALLKMMDLAPELINDGLAYMQIVGGFAFLQAIALTMSAVLRSHNKAYYPMRVTLLMNVLNITGNYALIFGKFGLPQLGVVGAAISTSSCRMVALMLLLYITFGKVVPRFSFSCLKPFPWDKLRNLLHIGLPAAGEPSILQFVAGGYHLLHGYVRDGSLDGTYLCDEYHPVFVCIFRGIGAGSGYLDRALGWGRTYGCGFYITEILLETFNRGFH